MNNNTTDYSIYRRIMDKSQSNKKKLYQTITEYTIFTNEKISTPNKFTFPKKNK